MRNKLVTLLFLFHMTAAFGGKPEHSKVVATTALNDQSLSLTFKVEPESNMAINLEGPWKLELKDTEGLSIEKTTLARAELDEKLTGYIVPSKSMPTKPQGTVAYTLTSFICTKDKTQCFREVHTGSLNWAVASSK